MKRLMTAILLITMLLSLCACVQEEQMVAPVSYYYLRSPLPNGEVIHGSADSVILADIRESAGRENDYDYLLKIYLTGPQDARFQSPFPRNTFLMNFKLEDGTATLVLPMLSPDLPVLICLLRADV